MVLLESSAQVSARIFRMEEPVLYADAHCHLDLFPDPLRVVEESRKLGVGIIITAGAGAASNLRMLELARGSVYGVAGISPDFVGKDSGQIEELPEIVKMNRNIIGIGEIGLDSVKVRDTPLERQAEAFEKQIDIAKAMELPVVVHARGALKRVMEILESREVERAVFHYFEGGVDEAKAAEKNGWLVSIPPIESGRRKRVIKELDLSSIVAETDSPAVGKSPADVVKVVAKIAELKGVSPDEAGERMTKTIKEYFYI
ncbi:MAG TPA: TatD family hydrolase [Candidatus Saccharimonadales bacterium]|nr:TatD family hydrolase [Candidatus Saccharimonadales bacterium]